MLERLDEVPWATLEHAYGPADDVPVLLRQLLSPEPGERAEAQRSLLGNVFHQGTRFPAASHVVPFLIEMCGDPDVPDRFWLLRYWGSLITGYFSVRERPTWGDGEQVYFAGEIQPVPGSEADPDVEAFWGTLHQIYRESLRGYALLQGLVDDPDPSMRAGAAWVLACLPTRAAETVECLDGRDEPSGWVRAASAFALGELGAVGALRRILAEDDFPAARCMAACELARIEPEEFLIGPLIEFLAGDIDGYANIPGAGGKSSGDAAHAIGLLPAGARLRAIPALCDRLDRARLFDTMPLIGALLAAAFPPRDTPVTELTDVQRLVLGRMVDVEECWNIGNLTWVFRAHGLPDDRRKCAALLGVRVAEDEALKELRSGLMFAGIGFFEDGRKGIDRALALDPAVFARATAPDECWLLCAEAFAEADPARALAAYRNAVAINPASARQVRASGKLAKLLDES